MLKQVTITLDTSDPLQAQLLVEYLAAQDRAHFGRCCLLLGYLAATRQTAETAEAADMADMARDDGAPDPDRLPRAPAPPGHIGAGLLGLK